MDNCLNWASDSSQQVPRNEICVGYVRAKWDTRPVLSHGKGQWLNEAEEVPRLKACMRRNRSCGYKRS